MGKKIDTGHISIFEFLREHAQPAHAPEGQLRTVDQLRACMRAAIKSCPLSRHQIAGEISHLTGDTITKEIIDSWTRDTNNDGGPNRRRIPAELLPAFCQVTGCNDPLILMGQMVGLFVLPGAEALRAEIQKIDEQIKQAQAKKRKRLLFLSQIEGD